MNRTRLWSGLKRILIRIGRWVLDELIDEGVDRLVSYMRKRVKVFRWRLRNRARAEWRISFLRGKISRWNAAIRWLQRRAKQLAGKVLDWLQGMAEGLPYHSPWESARTCPE
jgi:hypothetical protein